MILKLSMLLNLKNSSEVEVFSKLRDLKTIFNFNNLDLLALKAILPEIKKREFMSFAIIETGGKQYKVSASKILEIEKLNAKLVKLLNLKMFYF